MTETHHERKAYAPYGQTTTPQTVQFTQAYLAELNGWKKRRPQWAALCKAIKTESPREELYAAAADAGASLGEVQDLQTLYRRGRDHAPEAGRLDAVEKALQQAEKRLQAALKRLDQPGLSLNEQDAARDEAEAAAIALDAAKMATVGPRQAAQTLALAKSENLI